MDRNGHFCFFHGLPLKWVPRPEVWSIGASLDTKTREKFAVWAEQTFDGPSGNFFPRNGSVRAERFEENARFFMFF